LYHTQQTSSFKLQTQLQIYKMLGGRYNVALVVANQQPTHREVV